MVFTTTGSAGTTYLLPVQVSTPVTATGLYDWSLTLTATFSSGGPITRVVSGQAAVVVRDQASNPFGPGWSVAGLDQLVPVADGVLYVYGSGGSRFFAGSGPTYTSPLNDFGTLVRNVDNTYTYTSRDQVQWNFDGNGQLTTIVDLHGLTRTHTYAGGLLTSITEPGNATTLFQYDGNNLSGIVQPGNRTVTVVLNATTRDLEQITSPVGVNRDFTYGADHRLATSAFRLTETTSEGLVIYTYGGTTGLLEQIDRGSGTRILLTPAVAQGLATNPARTVADQGRAVLTDPGNSLTTYTLDSLGRATRQHTAPDNPQT